MHLSDCFLELFTYIRLLTESAEMAGAEYEQVRDDVRTLITRMDDRSDLVGVPEDLYNDARFAVFAWADEAVLISKWAGVRDWLKHPLQREFYGTANAGEEFFERLDKLFNRNNGPVDQSLFADMEKEGQPVNDNGLSEVLEVYALCLSLGFTGKYFSESGEERLEELHRECVARIPGSEKGSGPFFPQSYGTGEAAPRKCCYGRIFDPVSLIFFILPVLVVGGMYFAYKVLLEQSLKLWFG
ncbi:DotU family type IV/VI secretion system protein [Maridesulfovibrio salexigens]|uniref:Type IV / VI secretion system protein, DotU family n=1 Tax=Maridesulfovibrio salexigens (strain ATCC 14822 / DSM 2638 / NCIMB 8403 / VKM B-1763) TaxID=526222 RepID=C6BX21_MARSD|nr:DotU family type IV/VI secretion system protein [Maridesulfovibrio salexigens]ACS78501.1 type IV / VI secretion system protein, DotU family [Maridesulfovibrio salexigens DSM 2638]